MNDPSTLLEQLRIDRSLPSPSGLRLGKWLIFGSVALLLGIGGGLFAFRKPPIPPQVTDARSAPTSNVGRKASLLEASGYVVARRRATISAKISGRVAEIRVEEGQYVVKGDVIGRLDDANVRATFEEQRSKVNLARISVSEAEINLAKARRDYDRIAELHSRGFLSLAAFDNEKSNFELLRARLEAAKRGVEVEDRALAIVRRSLDDTIIRAPFSGVVTAKTAQPGEIISPISAGGGFTRTGICTIVDMASLEFVVDVNENFINRVQVGQRVVAKLNAYPDMQIAAHVVAIIPTADRNKGTVSVRIGIDRKDKRILPEMAVQVALFENSVQGGGVQLR